MFTFRLAQCSACGRTKPLKGSKSKRCYDCIANGYTKQTKNIPYRATKKDGEAK